MSKKGRLHAMLSEENFAFFTKEQNRAGVTQSTPVINMLLSELRELRRLVRRTPQNSTSTTNEN